MGVAGEVAQDVSGAAERRLGVDDPVTSVEGSQEGPERDRLGQRREPAMKRELPVGSLKMIEEPAPEQPPEYADGQEEPGSAGDPARTVGSEAATGDQTVDVRMVLEGLAPGVQHRQEAEFGTEVPGIGADRRQRFRGGAEQDGVEDPLVLQCDGSDLVRQGKDDVEVLDREDLLLSVRHPGGTGQLLALGAVAVATRVVGDALVATGVAALDVTAAGRGAAGDDVIEHASFGAGEPAVALGDEAGPVRSHDVG